MKKKLLCSLLIFACISEAEMVIVGKKAPDFKAEAVVDGQITEVSLSDYDGYYKLLVFYPLDFTFVCPTELHEIQNQLEKFKEHDTVVLGISVDSVYSHLAWLNTPKNEAGVQGVTYPLVSDLNKTISRDYGVLDESGVALRGAFILDRENIVQAAMINNLAIGRSVDEMVRLISAIQHVEKYAEVCPVNWQEGEEGLQTTEESTAAYLQQHGKKVNQATL